MRHRVKRWKSTVLYRFGRVHSSIQRLLYLTNHSSIVVVRRGRCVVVCVVRLYVRRLMMMLLMILLLLIRMSREIGRGQQRQRVCRLVAFNGAAACEVWRLAWHHRAPGLTQYRLWVFDFFYGSTSNVMLNDEKKV